MTAKPACPRSAVNGSTELAEVLTAPEAARLGARPRGQIDRATTSRAFSLIEVIAAVAIFAIGMVAVLGLFAPVTKSVASVSDADAAARAADAVRARVQALAAADFNAALRLVQEVADVRKKDSDGNYNPNDGAKYPAVIFGKLSGDVGFYVPDDGHKRWEDSSVPSQVLQDRDKFFEIDLIRNDALSPKAEDATSAMVAFTIRVRWPAFLPASSGGAVQVGVNPSGGAVPFDHSKKQVLVFTGSIVR